MRLQAFLSRSGAVSSRRKAESLITSGRVQVNGALAELGMSVSFDDRVTLDGHPVAIPREYTYLALNKPPGFLTTLEDPQGRPTVKDLMPDVPGLVPVGRLDLDTSGLILLTNDGGFAHRISHPSFEIEKEYLVTVEGHAPTGALNSLSLGPLLEDGTMHPPLLKNIRYNGGTTSFHLTIHEGRNRIVRRACAAVGLKVIALKRVRIGAISLESLPEGYYRRLTLKEIEALSHE